MTEIQTSNKCASTTVEVIDAGNFRNGLSGRTFNIGRGYFFTFDNADGYEESIDVRFNYDFDDAGECVTYRHEVIGGLCAFVLKDANGRSFRVDLRFHESEYKVEFQMAPVPFEIPADATGKDEAAAHVAAVTIIDLLKMEVQRQWEYLALRIKLPTVELMPDVIEQLRDL
jgi:hypothetical protein